MTKEDQRSFMLPLPFGLMWKKVYHRMPSLLHTRIRQRIPRNDRRLPAFGSFRGIDSTGQSVVCESSARSRHVTSHDTVHGHGAARAHQAPGGSMESECFDDLVRALSGDASRRGVVRAGLGALAAAALAALGLTSADEVAAKRGRRAKARASAQKDQGARKHPKKRKGHQGHHGHDDHTGPKAPPPNCTPGLAGCPPDDPGEAQDPEVPLSPEGVACQEDGECASGLCCLDPWDGLGVCTAAGFQRCDGNFDVCCGPGTECCETSCCREGIHCCWSEDPFCVGPDRQCCGNGTCPIDKECCLVAGNSMDCCGQGEVCTEDCGCIAKGDTCCGEGSRACPAGKVCAGECGCCPEGTSCC